MSARYPVPGNLPGTWRRQIDTVGQQLNSWWRLRNQREQRLLQVGGIFLVAFLIWTIGLQPAVKSIRESSAQLPQRHADAAQVHAYILEARALQRRHAGTIDPAQLTEALQSSLLRAGLDDVATLTTVDEDGETTRQWELSLFNASAVSVMEWLSEVPYLLRLQTPAITLERASVDGRDRPGHVSGRVLVSLPEKDQP
ncbi:type II secretion system protein M [Pusillimonas sp. MFBS29]|uniref:type II secretion system protein GspM n=1 Tax=Pusillimonas sp. MFBS29 TaxID=2886690 RepID=UPI001D119E84|nr:type II secretion system protein GspM [Pusillimonas sp. MFBS29]MCC2595589.1 type II secretion system protein M [Pusillimonas sp. MFBS29]